MFLRFFRDLRNELGNREPRLTTLHKIANGFLNEHSSVRTNLRDLQIKLRSLKRIIDMYMVKLGKFLEVDLQDIDLAISSSPLSTLSHVS